MLSIKNKDISRYIVDAETNADIFKIPRSHVTRFIALFRNRLHELYIFFTKMSSMLRLEPNGPAT